jgi:hypothetical protein
VQSNEDQWRTFFGAARIVLEATNAAERALRLRAGIGFNVFDWIQPIENNLSDIIRDLLDPEGSHGQGGAFLTLATKGLIPFPADVLPVEFHRCTVVREARTYTGRRIDLLLHFGQTAIGIENKPFAGESKDQLTDYARYLHERFSGKYYMVFLHGTGVKSESLEPTLKATLTTQGRFQEVPYFSRSVPCLYSWLVQCASACQAEKVRSFIADFAEYVARVFATSEETL